jgi:hypothetical protein
MKISKLVLWTYIMVLCCYWSPEAMGAKFEGGISAGYGGGLGFQGHYAISDFAKDFPLLAKFSMGYASFDPGKPAEAREIFINDATDGTPEKKGRAWNFRLDLLYQVFSPELKRTYFYAGPRYELFTGNFKYVGGNEDFDITTKQWGLGFGLESYFSMSPKIDLLFNGGFDYFLPNTLSGHDTSYSPNGEIVNGRKDFTYNDADKAINQHKLVPRMMAGFSYHFGK